MKSCLMRILFKASVSCLLSCVRADRASLVSHLLPFYVREHSKRILRGALWNDSKFLANLNIMDYSVVVAVDSTKNELVVGIVGER